MTPVTPKVGQHRQASVECFNLGEVTGSEIVPSASDGYYVMLQPLPPGKHEIKWGGVLPMLRQAVVYEIVVKEEAASETL